MKQSNQPFQSYLLRCWIEDSDVQDQPVWRFSIEAAGSRNRHGFVELADLVSWLTSNVEAERVEEDCEQDPAC